MKNSKKLLAGVGVCLALGGVLLTGCSSNINISQSDLNNLVNNANNYLVENQKQSSELVRSELKTLLVKGLNNSMYSSSFSYTGMKDEYIMGISNRELLQKAGQNELVDDDMSYPYSYTYKWTIDKENLICKRYYKELYDSAVYSFEAYDYISQNEQACYYHCGDRKEIWTYSAIESGSFVFECYSDVYCYLFSHLEIDLDGLDIVKYQEGENVVYSCAYIEDSSPDVVGTSILTFKGEDIVSIELRTVYGYVTRIESYTFDYENIEINFDTTGYEQFVS